MWVFLYVRVVFVFAGQIFNPDEEKIWDTLSHPGRKLDIVLSFPYQPISNHLTQPSQKSNTSG